jgi:hypothetical protein
MNKDFLNNLGIYDEKYLTGEFSIAFNFSFILWYNLSPLKI